MDIGKWLDNYTKEWRWSHLALLLSLTLVFLITFDMLVMPYVPQYPTLQHHNKYWLHYAQMMEANRSDPRMFLSRSDLHLQKKEFTIAWISDSSSIIYGKNNLLFDNKDTYTLQDVLSARVKTINGKRVRVLGYLVRGIRSVELYSAILHIQKETKPDMVIITINPFWIYNDWSIYNGGNWRGRFMKMGWDFPLTWQLAPIFLQPTDVEYDITSPFFSFSRRRYDGQHVLLQLQSQFSLTQYPLVSKNGVDVMWKWIEWYLAPEKQRHDLKKSLNWQHNALMLSNPNPGNLGWHVVDEGLKTAIKNTKKPTLIYLTPINPDAYMDPDMRQKLACIQQTFILQMKDLHNKNVKIVSNSMTSFNSKLVFKDYLHLHVGTEMSEFVIREMKQFPGLHIELNDLHSRYSKPNSAKTIKQGKH